MLLIRGLAARQLGSDEHRYRTLLNTDWVCAQVMFQLWLVNSEMKVQVAEESWAVPWASLFLA